MSTVYDQTISDSASRSVAPDQYDDGVPFYMYIVLGVFMGAAVLVMLCAMVTTAWHHTNMNILRANADVCPWIRRYVDPSMHGMFNAHGTFCEYPDKMSSHLEVLQWARAHGCPWNEDNCIWRYHGQLLMLQWARDNSCPLNVWTRSKSE